MKCTHVILFLVTLTLSRTADAAWGNPHTLQYPGSLNTIASGVYDGKTVGLYWDSSTAEQHGFIFDGENYTTLDYPGGSTTSLSDIDGSNIVGAYRAPPGRLHGFLYDESTFSLVDPPDTGESLVNGTVPRGIQGSIIVGHYTDDAGQRHGYFFDGSNFSSLDYPGGSINSANDIDGNKIVGEYSTSGGTQHGYIYDGLGFTSINHPSAGPYGTTATGISGGRIVGYYYEGSPPRPHGFVLRNGAFSTFDVPSSLGTRFLGIQGATIVGDYLAPSDNYRGFIMVIPEPSTFGLLALGFLMCLIHSRFLGRP